MNIRDFSHPGEILGEVLEERGWSPAELAKRTDLDEDYINDFIDTKVPLAVGVAQQLERVLGIPADFWRRLDFNYQIDQNQNKHG